MVLFIWSGFFVTTPAKQLGMFNETHQKWFSPMLSLPLPPSSPLSL
ncbi:hypothetical protein CpipJ_CPIJ017545 [Culex quinquefasciatus]|uniref:Uncharacterized protein n=1 Tax=Culex quinquefasciatus TaxID=7176 RepID=B0XDC8_CULQU|nr:hypothetical protein CpipJ_CPIJ017545 [Culex quinquefasciatus]|eukprot:XP_001867650.1 hypothetical protein CpipJ_CPIJ017545 [Culex quinquefasciatus]